jgi:ABC-type branched-subunit amino acid transport system substrate-binding protein
VEGALVIDSFSGGDHEEYSTEKAAEFTSRYQKQRNSIPGPMAAQAYDAALIVTEAMSHLDRDIVGRRAREAFRHALWTARKDGTCGPLAVTQSGELARQPAVLRADQGTFGLYAY